MAEVASDEFLERFLYVASLTIEEDTSTAWGPNAVPGQAKLYVNIILASTATGLPFEISSGLMSICPI